MKKQFFIPFLFLLASCAGVNKTSQPGDSETQNKEVSGTKSGYATTDPGSEKDNTQSKAGMDPKDNYRLVVSFYSKGEGTDSKAIDLYSNYIASFENQNNVKIYLDKTPWGREGEVDFCIRLNNLDTQSQTNFVLQSREILLQSQLVHIVENAPCMHKR